MNLSGEIEGLVAVEDGPIQLELVQLDVGAEPQLFKDAIYAARRSQVKKFKTGAALYSSRGRLLNFGWSAARNMNLCSTYYSQHAEHHCLHRVRHRCLYGATMVIVTISKRGNYTSGIPCQSCMNLLLKYGVKRVVASAAYAT